MTFITWGIDRAFMNSHYPHEIELTATADSVIQDTTLTRIIEAASTLMNATLQNAGLNPESIAANESNAKNNIKNNIAACASPDVMQAYYGIENSQRLEEERFNIERKLARIQGNPNLLGSGLNTEVMTPQVSSSTGYFRLLVDENSQRRRRRFNRGGTFPNPNINRKQKFW